MEPSLRDAKQMKYLFGINITFLHRSLRDFLLFPRTQITLHQYTGGRPLDTRLYLTSARAAQLLALASVGESGELSVGIASNIMSALWVNRLSQDTASIALLIRDTIEWLAVVTQLSPSYGWYIDSCFSCWQQERSNFLSLAIDFGLTSYVLNSMTRQSIQSKSGRPILDYILRPRFAVYAYREEGGWPGNKWTDPELLRAALACEANPNERLGGNGPSIWAVYLCSLGDCIPIMAQWRNFEMTKQVDCIQALSALVSAGAAPILPLEWLACPADVPGPSLSIRNRWYRASDETRFGERWPTASPIWSKIDGRRLENVYAVSGLLECLAQYFDIDMKPPIGS